MFDLSRPPRGFVLDPFPTYDLLLRDAPVCAQPDGSFVISKHADLSDIYRDTSRFLSDKKLAFGPKFGVGSPLYAHHTTSLVFNDPPLHTRVRAIIASALTPRALARMQPELARLVDGLLDAMPPAPDLIEDFAARIPVEVIGNLLDVPKAERGPLRAWSLAILGALEPTVPPERLEAGQEAVRAFCAYLEDLVARRRARPGDPETDVLTRLIEGDSTGQLGMQELLHNCIFILNAGHETTTNLIGNALALLNDHPVQRARLLEAPGLIDSAVEEVLRFNSPNQFGTRQTAEDVEMRGTLLPQGAILHLCIGAANRDGEVFEDPGAFDIARHPNRHLAFAGGPHVCIGLTLARMEGRIALARMLARYPRYAITDRALTGRTRFRGYERLAAELRE